MHIAVALLRISEGLDCSMIVGDVDEQKKMHKQSQEIKAFLNLVKVCKILGTCLFVNTELLL